MAIPQGFPNWRARLDGLALPVVAGVVTLVAALWAYVLRPMPFSDWAYYWQVAQGVVSYERGGVMVFVLRFLQVLGLAPFQAALVMNVIAAIAILSVAWRWSGRRCGLALMLVAAYLLAITPYFSVVQFDLPATSMLVVGLGCLVLAAGERRSVASTGLALLLVALAVSSRPQFLLVLVVFAGLLVPASLPLRRLASPAGSLRVPVVLLLGAMSGFSIDSALRAGAGRADAVRTTSAVTLYAGLLSSGTTRPGCGHWSPLATYDARADAARPLPVAIQRRLALRPTAYWLAVVGCKAPSIGLPSSFALSWSLGGPLASDGDPSLQHRLKSGAWPEALFRIEGWTYRALVVLIYLHAATMVVRHLGRRRWFPVILPVAWLASYWIVHAVFEIQGRYFLSLFLLLPLLARGHAGFPGYSTGTPSSATNSTSPVSAPNPAVRSGASPSR